METYYGAQAPSKAKAPDFPEAFELIRTMADGGGVNKTDCTTI